MALTDERERLPCGVELAELVTQVADGDVPLDPHHQRRCPYCQAALRRLQTGWADVRTLAAEPVPVPADLTARIMARVRTLARGATGSLLLGSPRGETRIAHTVVARSVQRLALTVPGVVFASVRAVAHDPPDPARLNVAVRLVVTLGPAVDAIADGIRALVDRHILRLTGGRIDRIDITVDDIAKPRG